MGLTKIDRRLQLKLKGWSFRPAGLDSQINAVSIKVIVGREIASAGGNSLCIYPR